LVVGSAQSLEGDTVPPLVELVEAAPPEPLPEPLQHAPGGWQDIVGV
jgi:hypothetical protein